MIDFLSAKCQRFKPGQYFIHIATTTAPPQPGCQTGGIRCLDQLTFDLTAKSKQASISPVSSQG